jgi:hypothetical protein
MEIKDGPAGEKQINIAIANLLDKIASQSVKEKVEHIEKVYNEQYKKDFETATLINDAPKSGELSYIKTKVNVEMKTQVYNKEGHIEIKAKTHADLLTLKSQDIGTGDIANEEVLDKFGIETKKAKKNELSKWYMNPRYHLTNFKRFLRG